MDGKKLHAGVCKWSRRPCSGWCSGLGVQKETDLSSSSLQQPVGEGHVGGCSWCAQGQGCHSEGARWTDRRLHKIQSGHLPCPVSGTDWHPTGNRLGLPGWGAALWSRAWGPGAYLAEPEPAGSWQGWRLSAPGCVSRNTARKWRKQLFLFSRPLFGYLWNTGFVSGPLNTWRLSINCSSAESSWGSRGCLVRRGWGSGVVQPGDGMASGTCCPQDIQRLLRGRLFAEVNSRRIRESNHKSEWGDFFLNTKKVNFHEDH